MKKYRMLKTLPGSRDGIKVETFHKGQTYDLTVELAEQFYHQAAVEEVTGDAEDGSAPNLREGARARSTKVTGPAEKKVTGPTETKDGEAGVDLDTQNIEELVALARDTYGLEVDSTMSREDVKAAIELATEAAETADKSSKKTKARK